jgi:hypothetical protein
MSQLIPWQPTRIVLNFEEEVHDLPFLFLGEIPPGFARRLKQDLTDLNEILLMIVEGEYE